MEKDVTTMEKLTRKQREISEHILNHYDYISLDDAIKFVKRTFYYEYLDDILRAYQAIDWDFLEIDDYRIFKD